MPVRTYLARIAMSLAIAAATTAAAPLGASIAAAATYDVSSCAANAQTLAPISGLDDAWTPSTTHASVELVRHCTPAPGVHLDGMLVEDSLTAGGSSPVGSFGEWRFDAPAGTSITRLRLWREIGKRDNAWQLYTRTADGTRLGGTSGTSITDSDCVRDPNNFTCQVGSPGGVVADWTGLNTRGVRFGIACANAQNLCVTGSTLHDAWAAVYSSIVTVDDPVFPTATGAGGSLLTSAYVRSNATATLDSATDSTGIKAVRVTENSTVLGETQLPCDDSRRAPCKNLAAPASVTVATARMVDGPHTIQVGATDAAGNFTAAKTQQVTVDNHAPAAPTPTSPTPRTVTAPSATVSWLAPGGQVAPVSAAHVTVCSPSYVCQSTTQPAGATDGNATVSLSGGYGVYSVYVSLEDAAGNTDPNQLASWQVVFPNPNPTAAPAPQQPLPAATPGPVAAPAPLPSAAPKPLASPRLTIATPTVARDRRTLSVRGSVASGVTGHVTVSVSARIHGRTRTVRRSATIRNRRYAVRLKLASSAWTSARVTVHYPGSSTRRAATAARIVHQRRR